MIELEAWDAFAAHEHSAPALVVNVKVVLDDPPLGQLQMPALFTADGDHNPGRFPGFENDNYLIGFCPSKVAIDKVITSSLRCFQDGRRPIFRTDF
jgi:hypothetical protein